MLKKLTLILTCLTVFSFVKAQTTETKTDEQNPFDEVKAKIIESQLIFTNWFFLQYQTIQFQILTKQPVSVSAAYNKDLNEFNLIVNKTLPLKIQSIKDASWDFLNEDEKNFLIETSILTNDLFTLEEEAIQFIVNINSAEDFEVLGNIHYELHAGKIDSLFKKTIKNYSYLSSIVNQRQYEKILKEKDEKNSLTFIRNISFVALVFFLIIIVLVVLNNRKKRLTNKKLHEQKELIIHQKKEIVDSINYANNIQKSILPTAQQIADTHENTFVLFIPRDIVSGDFYFFYRNPFSKEKIIACCDCTGHGVPGAFMSFIGYTALNKIIVERKICNPSDILEAANRELTQTLKQNATGARDGMDAAIVNINGNTMSYAGANRPAWIVRNNEIIEIKPSKNSIGGFQQDENRKFERHNFNLQTNDCVYLFSDGYADQFGGKEGKKLMSKKFKETLLSINSLSMPEQQKKLHQFIIDWKDKQEQVDDILVIGIKI
ncbi:MAG: SpoIIE family protein phosphatase [Bacteroidota bacterium]